jgi:hypothetical protein
MRPYEPLPCTVEYKDTVYNLDLSYAVFFAVADVLKDDRLMTGQKLALALDLFVTEPHPVDDGLLSAIYDLLKDDRPKSGENYMDIEQDWGFICAGFQQAYGIDLYSDKTMHIMRWQALLQGLPKGTKLMDIINIRAMPIPEANKHNADQIAEITRLKALYALKSTANNFQTGLGGLFDLLEARAKGV